MQQKESEVWDRLRQGDRGALDTIYQSTVRVLYSYGCKISSDKALVEDCIQDLFVELWEKKEGLGPTTSYKFYLFKSLRRKIIDKLQSDQHSGEPAVEPAEESYEFKLILSQGKLEKKNALSKAISHLSDRQKEVIYLRFYDELSFEEISQVMDIDVKSVYKMLYKAYATLKDHLHQTNHLIEVLVILLPFLLGFSNL